MSDDEPPMQHELDMALMWVVLNAIRLFHAVPFGDAMEAETKFLERWRAIPAKRRQAALDFEFVPPTLEETRRDKMREVLG